MYTRNRAGWLMILCWLRVGGSNLGWLFFFFDVLFSLFVLLAPRICYHQSKICTVIIVSSEQSKSQFYTGMHCCRCCCCCCCCCCSACCYTSVVAAAVLLLPAAVRPAAVLLLPAAVRHRVPDDQICWFIESDPSVFFLLIQMQHI